MVKEIIKKIALLLIVIIGVSLVSFLFVNLSPIDPAESLAQRRYTRPTPEQIEEIRVELELNKPLSEQYFSWLTKACKGDFGYSLLNKEPVMKSVGNALSSTLQIVVLALVFSIILIFPISIISAHKKTGVFDRISHILCMLGVSSPNFWVGILLMLLFAIIIPIFKVFGYGRFENCVLPALALAIPVSASGIRVFRSSLISGYNCDFVTYARARGLSERKIAHMVTKYSAPPIITLLAQSFGFMLAGSATVESVFSWPGLGSLLVSSIMGRDLPVINACVIIVAIIFVLVNFIADIINLLLNPMLKTKQEKKL